MSSVASFWIIVAMIVFGREAAKDSPGLQGVGGHLGIRTLRERTVRICTLPTH